MLLSDNDLSDSEAKVNNSDFYTENAAVDESFLNCQENSKLQVVHS